MSAVLSVLFSDNSYGTISTSLAVGDTALNFTTGHGARFPVVAAGQVLYCTMVDPTNVIEEIQITAHSASADTATIVRAQGGTAAKAWSAGARIEARVSATSLIAAFQEPLTDLNPIVKNNTDPTKLWQLNGTGIPTATTATGYLSAAGVVEGNQGAAIASASTINLDTATGDYVHVTGVTQITAVTLSQGRCRTVVFDGILTIVDGASLILPGFANNILTAAGDIAVFRGEAGGVVRMISYESASSGGSFGSACVVLSSKTTSSAASITFGTADFDWTKYDEYEFHFINVYPTVTAQNFYYQISENGGGAFLGSAAYSNTQISINGTSAGVATNSNSTGNVVTTTLQSTSTAFFGLSGKLTLYAPSGTASF